MGCFKALCLIGGQMQRGWAGKSGSLKFRWKVEPMPPTGRGASLASGGWDVE